jgi:hypothetical protein
MGASRALQGHEGADEEPRGHALDPHEARRHEVAAGQPLGPAPAVDPPEAQHGHAHGPEHARVRQDAGGQVQKRGGEEVPREPQATHGARSLGSDSPGAAREGSAGHAAEGDGGGQVI